MVMEKLMNAAVITPLSDTTGDSGRRRNVHRSRTAVVLLLPFLWLAVGSIAAAQIPPEEYAGRRAELRSRLGDGLYIFKADVAAGGRQEPNFNYLTGIEEPGAVLLMLQRGDTVREVLFLRGGSPADRIWEASGLDEEGARTRTGIEVRSVQDYDAVMREMIREAPPALISISSPTGDEAVGSIIAQMEQFAGRRAALGAYEGIRLVNAGRALRDMRAVKSAAEIELLQVASDITRLAHIEAMRVAERGMNEFEVQAAIEYTFRRYGAGRPGFSSIVGSGPNSLILHYSVDDRFMQAGEVMVMDIGAEYCGYTSDVTRTIPISGHFTREQRDIYEIVLEAHLAAAKLAEKEGTSFVDLSRAARRVLAEGLTRLGLIESPEATMPGGRGSQVSLFYMHGLGHGIGLVVHDSMPQNIAPGSCFTIEPGIYVGPDALERIGEGPEAEALRAKIAPVLRKYQNIGVRIEDSYAFTENGLVRLSAGAPRTVEEIEAVMAEESDLNRNRLEDLVNAYRRYRPPPGP